MAEFNVGDKVMVMFAGKLIRFTVKEIGIVDGGHIYAGEDTIYYPEERLDYDIDTEQKDYIMRVERRLQALNEATAETKGLVTELLSKNLPPSITARLSDLYVDIIGRLMS